MDRLLLRIIVTSIALWLTTLIVGGLHVVPFSPGGTLELVLTYLLVALVFGIVNAVIGTAIRIVAFPLYLLTLGLVSLLVNGFLLLIVGWLSDFFGFGLAVDGFWWGVLGALVLGILSWLIGLVLRPFTGKR